MWRTRQETRGESRSLSNEAQGKWQTAYALFSGADFNNYSTRTDPGLCVAFYVPVLEFGNQSIDQLLLLAVLADDPRLPHLSVEAFDYKLELVDVWYDLDPVAQLLHE